MEETDQTMQEKPAPKKLNASRLIGTIEWFNFNIGYGFIIPNDPIFENVFVHKTAFALKEGTTLKNSVIEQRLLEFDIIEDEERKKANNVTAIGGILLSDPLLEVYLMNGSSVQRRRSFRYRNYNNIREDCVRSGNQKISIVNDDSAPITRFNRWSFGYRSFNVPHKRRQSLNEDNSRSVLDENWRERNGANVNNKRSNRRRSVASVRAVNDDQVLISNAEKQSIMSVENVKCDENINMVIEDENKENPI